MTAESAQNDTPLKKARTSLKLMLTDVELGTGVHLSNISRIERGIQRPNPETAETLATFFKHQGITEEHILYPERFPAFRPKRPRRKGRR